MENIKNAIPARYLVVVWPLLLILPLALALFAAPANITNSTNVTMPSVPVVNTTIPTTTLNTTTTVNTTIPTTTVNATTIPPSNQTNSTQTNSTNSTTTIPPTTTIFSTPPLTIQEPYAIINRSNVTTATVRKGQITTITILDNGAIGGTQPYAYQWLESYEGSAPIPAYDCGIGNSASSSVVPCVVQVTPSMRLGKYVFQIEVTDATNTTVIDDGFTLIITNLTLSTYLIVYSGNSTATGTATGGSGVYDITWYVNGTFVNGTSTPCTLAFQDNGNTTGQSALVLTDGQTYSSPSCSYNLTDGNYTIKFAAADAENLTNMNSSVADLVVDWHVTLGSSPTCPINCGTGATLTATPDPASGYYITYTWYQGSISNGNSCSGTVVQSANTLNTYTTNTLYTSTTYCVVTHWYESNHHSVEESDSPKSADITVTVRACPKASPTLTTSFTTPSPITAGNSDSDQATLTGGSDPTGTIRFYKYSPSRNPPITT